MRVNTTLKLVTSDNVNRTMPVKPRDVELRKREYLTPAEIDKLVKAARKSGKTQAQGQRNAALILVAYRHGLRAQELRDLESSKSIGRPPRCMCAS